MKNIRLDSGELIFFELYQNQEEGGWSPTESLDHFWEHNAYEQDATFVQALHRKYPMLCQSALGSG